MGASRMSHQRPMQRMTYQVRNILVQSVTSMLAQANSTHFLHVALMLINR